MKQFYSTANYCLFLLILIGISFLACTDDTSPIIEMTPDAIDTMSMPMDTMTIDTVLTAIYCHPDSIYFDKDILPIFKYTCALSGCHDQESQVFSLVLDSYENITQAQNIKPYFPDQSYIFGAIQFKYMPLENPLSDRQIELVRKWILEGAKNKVLDCDVEPIDLDNISYEKHVSKKFETHCNVCHGEKTMLGGIGTHNYGNIRELVDEGKIEGTINWISGFSPMPKDGEKLDDATLEIIKSWIDNGALNN